MRSNHLQLLQSSTFHGNINNDCGMALCPILLFSFFSIIQSPFASYLREEWDVNRIGIILKGKSKFHDRNFFNSENSKKKNFACLLTGSILCRTKLKYKFYSLIIRFQFQSMRGKISLWGGENELFFVILMSIKLRLCFATPEKKTHYPYIMCI